MKKFLIVLLAAGMLLGMGITQAIAGPYVSLSGGATWLEDSDLSASDYDDIAELTFDTGYSAAVAFGSAYSSGARAEIEVAYRSNEVDEFQFDEFDVDLESADEEATSLAGMINVYYDMDMGSAIKPFIGAGIGYANVEVDDADDDVFAYQGMVGCGFEVSNSVTLDLQYRFFATDDPEFDDEGVTIEGEYMTHNVMLGARFNF